MTGKIFDIKRLAVHDGPGIRTTVFLKGCSLKCIWCHNPEGISAQTQLGFLEHKCTLCRRCESVCEKGLHIFSKGKHMVDRDKCVHCGKCVDACFAGALILYGKEVETEDVLNILMQDADFYKCSNGGVTISGGEPLLQADFCAELLWKLKEKGIHTAIDTCGNVPLSAFQKVLDFTDLFLFDVKHIDSEEHAKLTGCGNETILQNLQAITEQGAKVEIRIPLIPTCNSSDDVIEKIGDFLGKLKGITKVKVLPYHSYARTKYKSLDMCNTSPEVDSPTDEELNHSVSILKKYDLNAISGRE